MELPIFFAITLGLIVVFLGGLGFLAFAREEIQDYRSNFFRDPGSAMFRDLLNTFTFGGSAPAAAGLWFLGWVLILGSVIGEVAAIIIAWDAIIIGLRDLFIAIIIGLRDLFNWARGVSQSSTTTDLLCAELLFLSGPQLRTHRRRAHRRDSLDSTNR
jgi:hypothetical protein